MKDNKKRYTQKEKIAYYSVKVARAQSILRMLEKRLERVMSEDYQDWDDSLSKQLKRKKRA